MAPPSGFAAGLLKTVSSLTNNTHDLSLRQLALLEMSTQGDGTEVRLASAALDINKPACTRAADRLAEEGLMRRVAIPSDRRRALLEPTPRGRRLIAAISGLVPAKRGA